MIRTARGSAAYSRTPTDCCASTCPRERTEIVYSQEELDAIGDRLNSQPGHARLPMLARRFRPDARVDPSRINLNSLIQARCTLDLNPPCFQKGRVPVVLRPSATRFCSSFAAGKHQPEITSPVTDSRCSKPCRKSTRMLLRRALPL